MKKIIICVKEVPNTDKIHIDHEKGILKRDSSQSILNPPDEISLHWSLKLKKEHCFDTTVISMGPLKTLETLNYILSLGIDRAFLISDPLFGGSDTLATSKILSSAIIKIGIPDLLFFGSHSLDGDTGQVPGQVSELLQIPSFSNVISLKNGEDKHLLITQSFCEEIITLDCHYPCSISFHEKSERVSTYPKASEYFKKKTIPIYNFNDIDIKQSDIGLSGSPTRVIKVWTPQFKRESHVEEFQRESIRKLLNQVKYF